MIKIVIADDQSIIRNGLKMILDMEDDLSVVGLAANGDEAFELAGSLQPDVILMDIRMPECDGVLSTRKITEIYPDMKIIILTTFNDDTYIFEALKAGAKGYLLKDVKSDDLADSIRIVMKGGVMINQDVAARMVNALGSNSSRGQSNSGQNNSGQNNPREIESRSSLGGTSLFGIGNGTNDTNPIGNKANLYEGKRSELTTRELDIIKLIGTGKANKEIASELYLSEGTVKNHITNILSKLYLRDRTQIALYAAQNKII